MVPLLCRKRMVELSCGLVSSKVPLSLEVRLGVIRVLLSTTDNGPEALGAQKGLHFPLPDGVVGGTKSFEGRYGATGGFVGHGDRNVMRKAKESWGVSFEPGAERDRVGIDVAGEKWCAAAGGWSRK